MVSRSSVSRQHAKLFQDDAGEWWVEDMNSTNGTFVNESRIRTTKLTDADQVRFGDAIYKFLAGSNIESAYHEAIHNMAIQDGMTGIHNKRYFSEFLEREIAVAARHGHPLTLVMFDVDHFKKINDSVGHLAGDAVLKDLTNRIKPRIRREDLFARYGGEEFACVLPSTALPGGVVFGEHLRTLIEERPTIFDNQAIPFTISVGVTTMHRENNVDAATLVKRGRREPVLGEARRAQSRDSFAGRSDSGLIESEPVLKTLEDLGWSTLVDHWVKRCATVRGGASVRRVRSVFPTAGRAYAGVGPDRRGARAGGARPAVAGGRDPRHRGVDRAHAEERGARGGGARGGGGERQGARAAARAPARARGDGAAARSRRRADRRSGPRVPPDPRGVRRGRQARRSRERRARPAAARARRDQGGPRSADGDDADRREVRAVSAGLVLHAARGSLRVADDPDGRQGLRRRDRARDVAERPDDVHRAAGDRRAQQQDEARRVRGRRRGAPHPRQVQRLGRGGGGRVRRVAGGRGGARCHRRRRRSWRTTRCRRRPIIDERARASASCTRGIR